MEGATAIIYKLGHVIDGEEIITSGYFSIEECLTALDVAAYQNTNEAIERFFVAFAYVNEDNEVLATEIHSGIDV
jgi:hypothetical protein